MKHREPEQSIQVYPHFYSKPYYELEAWVKAKGQEREDAIQWQKKHGYLPSNIALDCVGVFPTRERAESAMEELSDTMENDPCCFIREKPLCMMMSPDKYIKEWSYEHNYLCDESLVRNYAGKDFPFLGRPKGMIRHKIGDIVQVVEDRQALWGVVGGIPPICDGQIHGDWTDDCYTIWLTPNQKRMVRAHHVFELLTFPIPNYVYDYLSNINFKINI